MKAGIVADNYKLPLFELELAKADFEYVIKPYSELKQLSLIQVEATKPQLKEIERICKRVEINAKRSN